MNLRRRRSRRWVHLVAATALLVVGCSRAHEPPLRVSDPVAGASEGDAAAVYLALHNDGDLEHRLQGARCVCAARASLHLSQDLDGVSMMTVVDSIEVPPGGTVELRPGRSHIMLEGLRAPLREGSTAEVTLELDRGEPVELEVPVVALESLNERFPR